MKITVHFVGDQFIAYDEQGQRVTDRNILQQIEFEPFWGTQYSATIDVDNSTKDAIIEPLAVNININTQR